MGQDDDQRVLVQIGEGCDHRQTAHKFRDQAEFQQIFGLEFFKDLAHATVVVLFDSSTKADARTLTALRDDLIKARERTTTDEQNVRGVDLQEFLLRMLTATLRRNRCNGAFHDLQQSLLHALARYVTGDGRVVRLAGDLIDLVDVNDAALCALNVVFRRLKQFQDDVFNVLTHITRFGQGGCVRHGERHIKDTGQRLGKQRFTATRRADQHDVRFRQFDLTSFARVMQAFVVVMHRNREHALCVFLTDHIVVQNLADIARCGHAFGGFETRRLCLFADDIHAEFDAFITNEHGRSCDQLAHLMLTLTAEAAVEGVFAVAACRIRHTGSPGRLSSL